MSFARLRSPLLLAMAGLLEVFAATPARAQSLLELYEAAHAYDATYLSARALADSAPFRVEQARALMRPNIAATASAARTTTKEPGEDNFNSNTLQGSINGRQPLFNRGNMATIAQSERSLESSLADLDSAEQDLMLRVSQAYFDVLGAQDTLETTRANKTAIAEQLASAKRNFEVG
ncbi:MAG: TolC family protein, partial [Caldimonas sp.]